ncbi:MAG TPA: hypothetical protein ENI42_00290, partial [Thermoplasmatales archaeon]|nr:hypothetical protein [Thermoplasmatales archaeon]
AVYSSGEDDTVHIHTGTYSENVVVNRGVNIVGEQRNTTTVEATHYLPFVFYVSQRDVNISNLTIGPYSLLGIMCVSVDNVTIYNNNLFSPVGVTLLSSLDTNIIHNIFSENVISILSLPFSLNLIFDSSLIMDQIETFSHTHGGLVIKNNNISNSHVGIMLFCADNNVITKNTIINLSPYTPDYINVLLLSSSGNRFQNNTLVNGGIFIYDSYNNQMHNNTVNGEPLVYLENLSHIVVDYGGQVILVNCDNITVENTVISNVSVAIELLGTNNSVIQNNDVSYCTLGVCMFSSHGNKVYSNSFHPALLAIVSTSGGNTIDGNTIQDSLVGVSVVSIESLTLSQPMENQIQLTVTGGDQPNIITNNNLSNVPFGIIVVSNASNTVENNTLTNPYSMKETGLGIAVISFETIQVQCFLNGTFQITARGGDGENSVTGNSLSNLTVGVVVISDAYNTITNNMLDNIYIGVVTVSIDSIHVTAEGEIHTYGYTSGELSATTHVSIAGGNRDVVVEDNQLFNSELGIIIISDAANTVVNNTLDNTEILGVTIVSLKSVDITAAQTQIRNNSVYHLQGNLNLSIIGGEKDNIVEENTLFNPGVGVVLLSDGSNTVAGNTIVNAQVLGTTIVSMSSTTVEVEFKQKDVYNPSVHNRTINATIEVSLHSGGVNNVVENNNVSAAEAGVIIVSNANNMVTGNMLNDIQLTGVVMFSLDKVFVDAELNQRSTSNHTGRVENNNGTIQVSLTGGEKTNVVENNSLLTSRLCGVTVVSNSDNVIGNNTLRNTTFGAGIMAVSLEKADLSLNFSFITHGSLQHVHNFSSELHIHASGGSHQNLIKDNKVQDSLFGIVAVSNADDTLFNNTLTNVESVGIMYVSLNSTSMSYDVNNSGYSFLFTAHGGETHSIIWDNQITDVDIQGGNLSSGVLVVSNANVTVENNTIHNLTTHKITTPTHNYSLTSKGILLLPANIRYTENVNSQVVDALVEILPDNAVNGHILRNNDIDGSDAGTGVSLWYSSNHHIYGNTIKNTTYGIHIPFNQLQKELNSQYCNISAYSYSNGSLIYHNNLINNTISAFDECNNSWNNVYPSGGNYCGDYTGTDFYRCLLYTS